MTRAISLLGPPPVTVPSPHTTWLVTFADLVLLLLTFFVLVFVMSQPVGQRYLPVAKSYLEVFNPIVALDDAPGRPLSFTAAPDATGDNLTYLRTVLETAFAKSDKLQNIQFRETSRYLILSMENRDLFAPGGTDIAASASAAMFDLAGVLGNLSNPLAVVGSGERNMPSAIAWSAGLGRANAVSVALANAGYDGSLAALARADVTGRLEIVILAEGTRR